VLLSAHTAISSYPICSNPSPVCWDLLIVDNGTTLTGLPLFRSQLRHPSSCALAGQYLSRYEWTGVLRCRVPELLHFWCSFWWAVFVVERCSRIVGTDPRTWTPMSTFTILPSNGRKGHERDHDEAENGWYATVSAIHPEPTSIRSRIVYAKRFVEPCRDLRALRSIAASQGVHYACPDPKRYTCTTLLSL
jgi:hypothetical protein